MKLINKIGTFEVIVLILTACLGIRWIPVAGSIGPSAIVFWIGGALIFFIPLSLIVMELSQNFTEDGGIYLWIRQSLGKKFGFYTAWLYWINNFFFYPGLLVFMVANLAYLVGNKHLAENHVFVVSAVIISLWVAILINIRGVKWIAKIASFSCVLNVSLGLFIIISGFLYGVLFHASVTHFTLASLIPNESISKNLSNLTLLMFALSGIELIPIMAGSVKNSRTLLKRAILISGIIIICTYILGTMAINTILTPGELNNTTGLMETFLAISTKLHIAWLSTLFISFLFLVEFGALIVWLIAPTILLFECAEPGIIPEKMQELNKHHVPANALLFVGIVMTVIIVLIQYLPTINAIFTALVLMGTIVYFIPYLFLAMAYFKLRSNDQLQRVLINKLVAKSCAILLFIAVFLGIILSFIPSADIKTHNQFMTYEIELMCGPLLFIALGYFMYRKHKINLG